MNDGKHPDPADDLLANTLLRMAKEGLVNLDGDKVTLTEEGRKRAARSAERNPNE